MIWVQIKPTTTPSATPSTLSKFEAISINSSELPLFVTQFERTALITTEKGLILVLPPSSVLFTHLHFFFYEIDIYSVGFTTGALSDLAQWKKLSRTKFSGRPVLFDWVPTASGGYLSLIDEHCLYRLYRITNNGSLLPKFDEHPSRIFLAAVNIELIPTQYQRELLGDVGALCQLPIFHALVLAPETREPMAYLRVRLASALSVITAMQVSAVNFLPTHCVLPVQIAKVIMHRNLDQQRQLILAIDSRGTLHIVRYNPSTHTFAEPLSVSLVHKPAKPYFFDSLQMAVGDRNSTTAKRYIVQFESAKQRTPHTIVFTMPELSMDASVASLSIFQLKYSDTWQKRTDAAMYFKRLCQINAQDFVAFLRDPSAPLDTPDKATFLTLQGETQTLVGCHALAASTSALGQFTHAPFGRSWDLDQRGAISLMASPGMEFYKTIANAVGSDSPRDGLVQLAEQAFLRFHTGAPDVSPSPLIALALSQLLQLTVSRMMLPGSNKSELVERQLSSAQCFLKSALVPLDPRLPVTSILRYELATIASFLQKNHEALALTNSVVEVAKTERFIGSLPELNFYQSILAGRCVLFVLVQSQRAKISP